MGKKKQRRQEAAIREATEQQLDAAKELQEAQSAKLEEQRQAYREFEFENPFADMENPFEDLTVSQEAARFQMEQGAQQRANLMAGLQGAAGASGIAGLAQALAGQGVMQARQVSADIDRQEAANRMAAAQGAQQVGMLGRQGAAAVQQAEFGRESTLLASELGEMAGARQMMSGALGNQMAGFGLGVQMQNARMGMIGDIVGSVAGVASSMMGAPGSDRKLKKNIKLVSKSPSGLPIYAFEYIDSKFGEGVYQGVMSDEIPQEAVIKHPDGYDTVDYSMIDVEFKKLK
tara:strand:+ start:426 stop:1292 length:867 start_codon:yes stop_codon:yes gene_type:complete